MKFLQLIILTVIIVALAFAGLALNILIKKGGKFPNTHVGGNKYLSCLGIFCAQTQDRHEQEKVKKKIDYKNVRLVNPAKDNS
ncbi:MAG: hypothetical protein GX820_04210 [Bacteroidales bacterium]|nr:hypothetical protein [Bacteroidales bacterium]